MATVDVKGKTIEVDEDGFLANLDDWSTDVANYFAEVEGLQMTDQHWEVVNFLREYYKQYQIAPMIKILVKEIGKKLGAEGEYQVPLRALSGRTREAGLQNRRSSQADGLRIVDPGRQVVLPVFRVHPAGARRIWSAGTR